MARISYADKNRPDRQALVERITRERGGVLHLYAMLLHSAPIGEGWLNYLTAIRQKSGLAGDVREMVIMRIAHLNGAPYEAQQHAPIAMKEGMTQAQLDALDDWAPSSLFSPLQRAVLAYTDARTRAIHVSDQVFADVKAYFDETGIVELTATIAAYNMVSRFLVALQIHATDPL